MSTETDKVGQYIVEMHDSESSNRSHSWGGCPSNVQVLGFLGLIHQPTGNYVDSITILRMYRHLLDTFVADQPAGRQGLTVLVSSKCR